MITGLDQMNPGARPELEVGYAGMRKIEIKRILLDHAAKGLIEFEDKGQTKDQLIVLAEGLVAQGKIPSVRPDKVDPRRRELDEQKARADKLEAQMAALQKQIAAQAPAAPVAPVVEVLDEESAPVVPLKRGPGRPKRED